MRNRSVDIALIVGLVLVAGAIVWTLFSLGRDPAPAADPSGPSAEGPAPDENGGVVPVEPGGGPVDDEAEGAADGDDAGVDESDGDESDGEAGPAGDDDADAEAEEAEGEAEAGNGDAAEADDGDAPTPDGAGVGASDGDRPDPEIPAAEAPPLPEDGPVELGRVGFSYVTGGAGACGVDLEAWTHIAVSRELLAEYGCGAEVTIRLDDEVAGRSEFEAIIGDTMNEARSRTVNVYVGEDEPALEFGLTAGTLIPQD